MRCGADIDQRTGRPSHQQPSLPQALPDAWCSSNSPVDPFRPQHFLYFFPLPHGQGSFLPTFGVSRTMVLTFAPSPCTSLAALAVSLCSTAPTVSLTP